MLDELLDQTMLAEQAFFLTKISIQPDMSLNTIIDNLKDR